MRRKATTEHDHLQASADDKPPSYIMHASGTEFFDMDIVRHNSPEAQNSNGVEERAAIPILSKVASDKRRRFAFELETTNQPTA
jgi:hypothetical protein